MSKEKDNRRNLIADHEGEPGIFGREGRSRESNRLRCSVFFFVCARSIWFSTNVLFTGLPRSSRPYFLFLFFLCYQSYRQQRLATFSRFPWWNISKSRVSIFILISAIVLPGKRSVINTVNNFSNMVACFAAGYVFKFGWGNKNWIYFVIFLVIEIREKDNMFILHISQKRRPYTNPSESRISCGKNIDAS